MVRFKQIYWQTVGTLLLAGTLGFLPGTARADNWALLIGIDQYQDSDNIATLGGADRDAKALAKVLTEVAAFPNDGQHIRVLVSGGEAKVGQPLKNRILRELETLKQRVKPGDIVFVAFSGHGVESGGVPYLLPYDADISTPDLIRDTGIPEEKFRDYLKAVPARAVIIALDMCRVNADRSGRGTGDNVALTTSQVRGMDFSQSVKTPGSAASGASAHPQIVATFFACAPSERSFEWREKGRGYFSYFLEQGLRGAASSDGKVSLDSLKKYLATAVPEAVRREELGKSQTPTGRIDGPLDAGDFVLVKGATSPEVVVSTGQAVNTKARLAVTVNAPDAVITVAGMAIKEGAYSENLLDADSKEVLVKVTAKGYEGQLVTVKLLRGKTVTLPVKLEAVALPAPVGIPPVNTINETGVSAIGALPALLPDLIAQANVTVQTITEIAQKSSAYSRIAATQINSGNLTEAKKTISRARNVADSISDVSNREGALVPVVAVLAKSGDFAMARSITDNFLDGFHKSAALWDIALAQAKANDLTGAKETLRTAKSAADSISSASQKSAALQYTAETQAEIGDIVAAKATAENAKDKLSVLSKIAMAQAKAGDIEGAKATAETISDTDKKLSILSDITVISGKSEDVTDAKAIAERIKDSYSKALAFCNIALSQIKAGDFEGAKAALGRAKKIASSIDNSLLQRTVFSYIAKNLAKAGDVTGAKAEVEKLKFAFFATAALQSIALSQGEAGDNDGAKKTLAHAKEVLASTNDEDWKLALLSGIAIAQAKTGDPAGAKATAEALSDAYLKTSTLCGIADEIIAASKVKK